MGIAPVTAGRPERSRKETDRKDSTRPVRGPFAAGSRPVRGRFIASSRRVHRQSTGALSPVNLGAGRGSAAAGPRTWPTFAPGLQRREPERGVRPDGSPARTRSAARVPECMFAQKPARPIATRHATRRSPRPATHVDISPSDCRRRCRHRSGLAGPSSARRPCSSVPDDVPAGTVPAIAPQAGSPGLMSVRRGRWHGRLAPSPGRRPAAARPLYPLGHGPQGPSTSPDHPIHPAPRRSRARRYRPAHRGRSGIR